MKQSFHHSARVLNPVHVDLDIRDQMLRAEYVRLLYSPKAFFGWWMYDRRTGNIHRYSAIIGTLQDAADCYPLPGAQVVAEGHHSDFLFLGVDRRTREFYRWIRDRQKILQAEAEMKKAPALPGPYVIRYRVAP